MGDTIETLVTGVTGFVGSAVARKLSLEGTRVRALVRPGSPMMFGAWPLVSDLRTGSFTGGSGEQALLMAAVAQMANFYNLPGSVAAGMTDAKLPDNQAGFEKGVTTTIVALAGGNFVSESAGMLASLVGVSYEALVIDNDMLGLVQRTLRGIEVTGDSKNCVSGRVIGFIKLRDGIPLNTLQ